MKLIGAIFLLIVFASMTYAQDLFDRAEIEFDIDYIDIDKVKILGGTIKGQVMAVWMKSGSVLTKTLSKSNSKVEFDNSYDDNETDEGNAIYNYQNTKDSPVLELDGKSDAEIIAMANDIINKPEWTYNYKWSTVYAEEIDLSFILGYLYYTKEVKGAECVRLAMDVIAADIEHGQKPNILYTEQRRLKGFAEGDEQLTKMANDFLEENGFNKEN